MTDRRTWTLIGTDGKPYQSPGRSVVIEEASCTAVSMEHFVADLSTGKKGHRHDEEVMKSVTERLSAWLTVVR